MSRRREPNTSRRGPQLPFSMREKLGLPENQPRQRTQVAQRKQRRLEARREGSSQHNKRRKLVHPGSAEDAEDAEDAEEYYEQESGNSLGLSADEHDVHSNDDVRNLDEESVDNDLRTSEPLTKPSTRAQLLKHNQRQTRSPSPTNSSIFSADAESDDLSRGSREYSPEVVLDANSTSFKQRQAEDDAEVLALEKRLGLKNKSKNKKAEDGFDNLLDGLEDAGDNKRQKEADKQWLKQKRPGAKVEPVKSVQGPQDDGDDVRDTTDSGSPDVADEAFDPDDDFGGFEDRFEGTNAGDPSVAEPSPRQARIKENPYVAPVPIPNGSTKYIPPSRRKPPENDDEKLDKLRRQVQGLLNKLSEANIISIVDEFDKLYQTNPRQDVSAVLVASLLTAFCIRSALQNTFIILHAALVAAIYKIQGADFGAYVVSQTMESFDIYNSKTEAHGKEALNLLSLLANFFTFGVVSSALVYDYIRLLLSEFDENNAELLLRVVRDCGPQLRSDDPTALKGIVQIMNETSAKLALEGQTVNIRTRVMMDAITDLKNNKTRQATHANGSTGEHLTRMRKALGSLNNRQLRGTEPLGITRHDILNSNKKGKWWLVGASWKGHDSDSAGPLTLSRSQSILATTNPPDVDFDLDPDEIDYSALSRHYKFTTPTHRSLFTAILSATDATDALARISKLRLTRKQEPEIPKVLLRLCRAEPNFNAYYAILARLLLREQRRYKFAFEVTLWKFFEEIGENTASLDEAEDYENDAEWGANVQLHEISNVAQLFATLISRQVLNLDVLKTLNIGFLKENGTLWLEMLFINIFIQSKLKEDRLVKLFTSVRSDMAKSLSYFLSKNVKRSNLIGDTGDRARVKRGVRISHDALAALERGQLYDEAEM